MEDKTKSITDLIILDYLKQNSPENIVKGFVKGKKIKAQEQTLIPTNLKDVLKSYKDNSISSPAAPSKSGLITSTPKPPITKKRTESSSSDEDSDDEADSDNDNRSNITETTEKKKQLTKTRKKNSGMIHFLFRKSFVF